MSQLLASSIIETSPWVAPAIGWLSSAVLLATTIRQLKTQWDAGSTEGVSRWLFVGQTLSSVGFTTYSALLRNWVFTITNSVLLVSALVGCWISYWLTKHPKHKADAPRPRNT